MQSNQIILILGLISIAYLSLGSPRTVSGCGPGRAGGRRRMLRKYPPLVQRQSIPNVSEDTLGASGRPEGAIKRKDKRFKELVQNLNPDIEFRDDERTGADRMMTQRLKEKLSVLAISVMNQWPNVKLRVIEGWDEDNRHTLNSLHYEGRAVDITTSDRDRSKYGMLARLAVEAGFDWVNYESRSHVHCSVKSEKADTIRNNGCFDAQSTVETPWGQMEMSQLQVNDLVLTMNTENGQFQYSPVILWLDRDESSSELFVEITTKSGRKIRLTSSHLIYVSDEQPDCLLNTLWSNRQPNQTQLVELNETSRSQLNFAQLLEANSRTGSGNDNGSISSNSIDDEVTKMRLDKQATISWRTLEVNNYAYTTYAKNALVGQYLLVRRQSVSNVEPPNHTQKAIDVRASLSPENLSKLPKVLVDPFDSSQSSMEPDRLVFEANPKFSKLTANGTMPNYVQNSTNNSYYLDNSVMFDQITSVNFVTRNGLYAPLTREGTIVVDSVVASCYALLSDHRLAHLSFAPIRWLSYMNEWIYGVEPECPTISRTIGRAKSGEQRTIVPDHIKPMHLTQSINRRKGFRYIIPSISRNKPIDEITPELQQQHQQQLEQQQRKERHIHWYPMLLYDIAQYIIPSDWMY